MEMTILMEREEASIEKRRQLGSFERALFRKSGKRTITKKRWKRIGIKIPSSTLCTSWSYRPMWRARN